MKYRRFGKLDWEASVLGFGVMHLPVIGGDPAKIDETESIRMIRYAIDQGVNYLDLGYPYNMRRHEQLARLIRRALQDGYRDRIRISATLPFHLVHSAVDFDRYLEEELRWLQMDRIDFYFLGVLNQENWPRLQALDALSWAVKAMVDGRIDKLGFSFHDDFQVLRKIINAFDRWAICQFQYSYMDVDHHPGVSGIQYAYEQGLAVVVTQPLGGGRLVREPPESVAKVWAEAPQERSLAEWALRWGWNHPEVSIAVTDMGTMEQVMEDVAVAENAEPDRLSVQELVLISRVRDAYRKLKPIPCTSCRCCMPCPEGIDVPRLFEIYNDAVMYGDLKMSRLKDDLEEHPLRSCTGCEICVSACPKKIPIPGWLKRAHQLSGDRMSEDT